jgi:hypothetical protein
MGGHRIFMENEGISRSANLFRVVSNNTQRVPSDIRDASMAIQECLSGCAATSARAIWQSPPFSQASMVGLQIWGTLGTGSHALWTYFSLCSARTIEPLGFMERAMGIEPTSEAWEASILPLYDARSALYFADYTQLGDCSYIPAIFHIFQSLVESATSNPF